MYQRTHRNGPSMQRHVDIPRLNPLCIAITIIPSLLLQVAGMIYLEDIEGAFRYDVNKANGLVDGLPHHYLSDVSPAPSLTPLSTSHQSATDAIDSVSTDDKNVNSSVFDRHLSNWLESMKASEEIREANNKLFESSPDERFDDLLLINSSSQYVHYDSKQASFGSDLGPEGKYELVNLMLPPRDVWDGLEDDGVDNVVELSDLVYVDEDVYSSNSTITGEASRLADSSLFEQSNETNQVQSPTSSESVANASDSSDGSTSDSSRDGIYTSDYFCLEDFVEWKTQRPSEFAAAVVQDGIISTNPDSLNGTALSQSTPQNSSNIPLSYIASTRPLSILALRGRCSFESKAQMAMLLNELFRSHNMTNRITHVIVYNNGTEEDEMEENLIDLGEGMEEKHENHYKVGMLYVTTSSGRDLIQRIEERRRSARIEPHLNVEGLFEEAFDASMMMNESTSVGYNDTIQQGVAYHDPSLTNGWSFPATLTRFCLSCGPQQNYGFDPIPVGPQDSSADEWRPPKVDNDPHGDREPYNHEGYTHSNVFKNGMIPILEVILIGPFVFFAAWRWRSVGGTIRLTRDENGARRLRLIAPTLQVFWNGVPGTVEENGAKLDRSQVFALPEMEFRSAANNGKSGADGEFGTSCEIPENVTVSADSVTSDDQLQESLETGLFVSSTCCSICIEEFEHGEQLRVLPCNHSFHTECILPWLTERQGCCPLCKTPVLPDKYQHNKRNHNQPSSNSSPLNRFLRLRCFRGRVHQPQSTPIEAANVASDVGEQQRSPGATSPNENTSEQPQELKHSPSSENEQTPFADEEQNSQSDTFDIQSTLATMVPDSEPHIQEILISSVGAGSNPELDASTKNTSEKPHQSQNSQANENEEPPFIDKDENTQTTTLSEEHLNQNPEVQPRETSDVDATAFDLTSSSNGAGVSPEAEAIMRQCMLILKN